jgi:hypothetical protein
VGSGAQPDNGLGFLGWRKKGLAPVLPFCNFPIKQKKLDFLTAESHGETAESRRGKIYNWFCAVLCVNLRGPLRLFFLPQRATEKYSVNDY